MIFVSLHREPLEVGLVEKLSIGGWNWVCHPYIVSATHSLFEASVITSKIFLQAQNEYIIHNQNFKV